MTKNELNTLVRKIQNECGLEAPTKITYYWNKDRKLVFKLFFESLAVPENLKIDEENIQNLFTVNNTYIYEDDFLITSFNTEAGFVEVLPNDQNFKVINSYKDLAEEKESELEENIIRLAGKKLHESVAKARGFILYESEEGGEDTNQENENKAASNGTATAYMCGEVQFIGKEEKDLLINIFKEWAQFDTEEVKNLIKKAVLKDGIHREDLSIVQAINETNVNVIVSSVSQEDELESAKYCVCESNKLFLNGLVNAADKDNSIVLLAPNTIKPDALSAIQKEGVLNDALNSAWQSLQSTSKASFEFIDNLTKELATEFTSEQVFGSTADLHTPFTAAFMKAQTGQEVQGKKEDFDEAVWKEYNDKEADMKQALDSMKKLSTNQVLAMNWISQQAANLQVATIDEAVREEIKQNNEKVLETVQKRETKKGDLVSASKLFVSGNLDAAGVINSKIEAGTNVTAGDNEDKPWGITADVQHTEAAPKEKEPEKEPEKAQQKKLFEKQSYFGELLKAYCLLNKDRFDQIVDRISVEG